MHIEERTVDINKREARSGQIKPIVLRRGETGETQIKINITSDGVPYSLSEYTAKLCAYLPENDGWVKDASHVVRSTNYVTYTVNSDLTSQEGKIRICYVELSNGSKNVTTDCIPLVIEADVTMSGQEAEEYTNNIDSLIAEVEKQLQEVNSAEKAIQDAEAKRVTAEQGRVSAENGRVTAESTRQSNETARKTAETSRDTAEQARVKAEQGRVSAESGRVSAENGRVSAESTRVTEQAKNNADQAANNLAAAQIAPHVCVSGEYADGKPTVTGSVEGRIYLVPTGSAGDDRYTEWMWLGGQWERVGTSSGGEINYITTDQIDDVIADKAPTGDTVLSLTGISYFWAKIKEWASNTFRKAADAIGSSDIADGAVTNAKLAGTIPVNKGGTGATTLSSNQVVLGNGTNAIKTTSAVGTGAFYRTSTTGVPSFGTLPIEQGGTGEATLDGAKDALGVKALEEAWDSACQLTHLSSSEVAIDAGKNAHVGNFIEYRYLIICYHSYSGLRSSVLIPNGICNFAAYDDNGTTLILKYDYSSGNISNLAAQGTVYVSNIFGIK